MSWFIRDSFTEQVSGPLSDTKLKSQASSGEITPDTEVSRSAKGPWVSASRVKGLFEVSVPDPLPLETDSRSMTPESMPQLQSQNRRKKKPEEFIESDASFFHALFDTTFTHFVTPRIIRLIFFLTAFILLPIVLVGAVFAAFYNGGIAVGLGALLGAFIVYFLYVLFIRLSFEVIMVLFRIEKNTRE